MLFPRPPMFACLRGLLAPALRPCPSASQGGRRPPVGPRSALDGSPAGQVPDPRTGNVSRPPQVRTGSLWNARSPRRKGSPAERRSRSRGSRPRRLARRVSAVLSHPRDVVAPSTSPAPATKATAMNPHPRVVVFSLFRVQQRRREIATANAAKMRRVYDACLAWKRKQDPCPKAVSVNVPAQHEPCPAPAAASSRPTPWGSAGPRGLPDGCASEGTHGVRP